MTPPSLSKSSSNFTTHVNGFNPSPFRIKGSNLLVNDHVVLSDVPENITATPYSYTSTTKSLPTTGCFIGFDATEASSHNVVPIGNQGRLIPQCCLPYGEDPFSLVKEAMKIVRAHLDTFNLLDEKTPPSIVDKFGWCTWDAFYLTVHPQGIWDDVKGLVNGGCPLRLVLIDNGWQSVCHDRDPITIEGMNHTVGREQMPCRLIKYEENYKFRNYVSPKRLGSSGEKGLGAFVKDLKDEFKTVECRNELGN